MINKIDLVACINSKSYGIGYKGNLLYNIKEDLRYFKDITTSKGIKDSDSIEDVVIMGRKTWQSLPEKSKPLKGRVNVILTSDLDFQIPDSDNIVVINSLETAIALFDNVEETKFNIHIIGGGNVYREAIEKGIPEFLYLTEVEDGDCKHCDTYFPKFLDKYVEIEDEGKRDNGTYSYTFKTYARKV